MSDYKIVYEKEVTSTNEICMELGKNDHEGGYVLVAEAQTNGRGRLGRDWHSIEGKGLYMTILERPERTYLRTVSRVTLVVAMALRKAVEEVIGMDCSIKWPNDIVYRGKKIAGILSQTACHPLRQLPITEAPTIDEVIKNAMEQEGIDYMGPFVEYFVVGIGLNLFHETFPEELQDKATSIYLENFCEKDDIDLKNRLIISIIENWKKYYFRFLDEDFYSLSDEYNEYLAGIDSEVVVHDPAGEYIGISLGVSPLGELEVETADGIRTVSCGEVSVRGVNGYV